MSRLLDVRLDNFEGPLDLLIHLIYKNELNIYDIPIAFIAEQFVEAVNVMEKLDIEIAAEFINMASYLIYLKSRMLLPKDSYEDEEMDPEEEKFLLTQRLVEYSFYKDVAENLRVLEVESGKYLMRSTTLHIPKEEIQTEDPYSIANAFFSVLEKSDVKPMRVERDIVDVADVIIKIKEIVFEKHKLFWTDIVKTCVSRREVVVALLAILELMRLKFVEAMQADTFGEIVIEEGPALKEEKMDKEQKIFYTSLFLSGSPLDKKFFRKFFEPINLENRLLSYVESFNALELGLKIRMVSGGYQMVTDKELVNELEPYFGEKTDALSRASLETSAIIAYKQPITRIEIDEIRGVNSSGTVRYLLEKNLIKVTGRKDVPGRPLLYSTTKYFLEYMGINDISELPTFREWQELKTKQ